MNTLNYKVLFTKISFIIFIRAVGIYLLITLPTLGVPVIYMMSSAFALSFGWIAAVIFLFLFLVIQKLKMSFRAKHIFLYVSVAISVIAAFQMIEIMKAWDRVWHSGEFLLFPAVAVLSGWISMAVSKRAIKNLFTPAEINYSETVSTGTAFITEE